MKRGPKPKIPYKEIVKEALASTYTAAGRKLGLTPSRISQIVLASGARKNYKGGRLPHEYDIAKSLRQHGVSHNLQGYSSSYDSITADGKRLEFKTASPRKTKSHTTEHWLVNLHRHGKLDESKVDYYVIRLERFASKWPLFLIVPAPVGSMTIVFSVRNIINQWYQHAGRFDLIGGRTSKR